MNKKGFTLVELLFVIVLMAIITLITLPSLNEMLKSSKSSKYENYEKLLVENLKLYNIDNKEDLWASGDGEKQISYDELLKTNRDINIEGCTVSDLRIIKNDNNYKYLVCMSCSENNTLKNYGSGC